MWTKSTWAAITIQRRWKGFITRRAFLRDRRMQWMQKRADSMRLHQGRRWKWMDTKDNILDQLRTAAKVCQLMCTLVSQTLDHMDSKALGLHQQLCTVLVGYDIGPAKNSFVLNLPLQQLESVLSVADICQE